MMLDFPLNVVIFFTVIMLKLIFFHISFLFRFITSPILLSHFCFIRVNNILVRAFNAFYLRLISFISSTLNSYKSHLIKSATRFKRAVLCSLYVLVVLLFLLFSCFAIGGIVITVVAEAPIFITHKLNFDYTKTSPTATVPLTTQPHFTRFCSRTSPPIPCNRRMQITVSLTLPESDHNRKLGVFQVRVEGLSANNEVILGSSYPTMLRFKSEAIRAIESSMKMVPTVAGLKWEVQDVKMNVIEEYVGGEGCKQIMGFRVSLEKRAGVLEQGVPQIYGASIDIASKSPFLKRMVWNWRLTILVWIAFASFLAEFIVILLFCTPILLPGKST